ncbi:hypothetical protein E1176_17930, partial [Fulvivirga sp. RKSG066]|uniref:hypothetical protein n=1 Tax=Fulvivirga aurantia TaxID=2529383 RepID=UPI001CA44DA7
MSNFQKELYMDAISSLDVPFKITDDFPGYIGYELTTKIPQANYSYGVNFAFRSTGGRISYSDYSGKYTIDNKVRAYECMGSIGTNLYKIKKISFDLSGYLGIAYTDYQLSSAFQINDLESEFSSISFSSL